MATATTLLFTALAGILLLGFIVFIHELGHFLVAKACGVRVLTFSLGFGPRLFGVKVGDTEYRLSALPLGGYVRMFGDDFTEDIPEEEKRYSFLHKAIPARIAIAFAGPLANFILPVALFAVFNLGTHKVAAPVVGTVLPSEPAAKAGILPGDVVQKVDGIAVSDFGGIQSIVTEKPGTAVTFTVKRGAQTLDIQVTPRAVRGGNPLSLDDEKGRVGIVTSSRLPRVHVSKERARLSPAIGTGDLVTAVNGAPVATYKEFVSEVNALGESVPLTITVQPAVAPGQESNAVTPTPIEVALGAPQRGSDSASSPLVTVVQQAVTKDELAYAPTAKKIATTRQHVLDAFAFDQRAGGLSTLEGTVVGVTDGTSAAAAGLTAGDRIVSIDGHQLTHAGELSSRLFEAPDAVHVVGVIGGSPMRLKSAAKKDDAKKDDAKKDDAKKDDAKKDDAKKDDAKKDDAKKDDANVDASPAQLRLVVFRMLPAPKWGMEDFRVFGVEAATAFGPAPLVDKEVGVGEAVKMAVVQTGELFRDTLLGMYKLATGQLSVRSMGGPITIFSLAGQAAERGAGDFVFLMAFISINLGIVNLLPVPILDGGHILLFSIEAIRRKRMSLAAQEKLLKVGLGLLGALMVLAFFNDIMRLL